GAAAAVLGILLALTGCGKIDERDVSRISTGMSPEQVHKLLGEPHQVIRGSVGEYTGTSEMWYTAEAIITVQYLNNEVKLTTLQPRRGRPTEQQRHHQQRRLQASLLMSMDRYQSQYTHPNRNSQTTSTKCQYQAAAS